MDEVKKVQKQVSSTPPEGKVSDVSKQPMANQESDKKLVKKLPKKDMKNSAVMILVALVVVSGGIGSGWFLSRIGSGSATTTAPSGAAVPGATDMPNEAGVADESTFRDTAEGVLVAGGIDGEGTHHLDRGLGPEKHVYLTSTVIDLESFVDKKVQVWGETVTAQKAGWLMDVGKIKVVE